MSVQTQTPDQALQRFTPPPDATYSIDVAAHLAQIPRHLILVCVKHGLVEPLHDPEYGGYYFDAEAIRTLQRVAYLHGQCGVNIAGIRMILGLVDEVQRLRERFERER
jgi:DNA-binding transcriptional MerR regulator